jgi:hypothetical protein
LFDGGEAMPTSPVVTLGLLLIPVALIGVACAASADVVQRPNTAEDRPVGDAALDTSGRGSSATAASDTAEDPPIGDAAGDTSGRGSSVTPATVAPSSTDVTGDLGPLTVSPDNPRYFSDGSGRPILLAGSHTWTNFQDGGEGDPPPTFDYGSYLDFLSDHDHNFFRLWVWEQGRWFGRVESDEFRFSPTPFARTGPGTADDGLPGYDLTQFDDAYFDRLRTRVLLAGERGIYVSVMLFNGFSVSKADVNNSWRGHPFNASNNVNGIDGDPNGDGDGEESHTLELPAVTAIQEAYVRRVVDAVGDLDNVLYEISNESHSGSRDWQYHMIDVLRSAEAELPEQHPIGMTVQFPDGDNADLLRSAADWISPNGSLDAPAVADGSKVILADTDHLCGVCGDAQWAWRSFLRGENPIFMDPWDDFGPRYFDIPFDDPTFENLRDSLGEIRRFASRLDLASMTPRPELASSGYVLADTEGDSPELVVLVDGGPTTIDLTGISGSLRVEWFDPLTEVTTIGDTVSGGAPVELDPADGRDAVVHLRR